MISYLLKNKKGKLLTLGSMFLFAGLVLENFNSEIAKYIFLLSLCILGFYPTLNAIKETVKEKSPNDALLMVIAALGAVLIDYASEGAILIFIFAFAEVLEEYISKKSNNAVKELMEKVPEEAKKIQDDGSVITVKTELLKIGDKVSVSKGDSIPIDGYCDRNCNLNESALTGESLPVSKKVGDEVFSGTINEGEAFVLTVSKEKKDTVFSNIIRMVESSQNKPSKKGGMIEKFESKYVKAVLILVPLFIFYLYFVQNLSFNDAFYRGMVLLTVASPCALVASFTPATLSAIGNGAKNGILFKNGKAVESLSDIDIIATDKTGTLTEGNFEIVDYILNDELIKEVCYMEANSNHPIAKAIYSHFSKFDFSNIEHRKVEEIPGMGLKMGDVIIGKKELFKEFADPNKYLDINSKSGTISFISKGQKVEGYIILKDKIRDSAKEAVNDFNEEEKEVVMLTGDNEEVAKEVSKKLNIRKIYSNIFPKEKQLLIKEYQEKQKMVLMIGDGINDAPALSQADLGVSMGAGSSIAMESSDIVIVKNDLNKLFFGYKLSKKLKTISLENFIFSISVIICLVILNVLNLLDLPKGVIFHETSTILVILNGLRLLYFK